MPDLIDTLEAAARAPHGIRLSVPDPQSFRAAFDAALIEHPEYATLSIRIAPLNPNELWICNAKV